MTSGVCSTSIMQPDPSLKLQLQARAQLGQKQQQGSGASLQEAKQRDAAMLFLPECCSFIGVDQAEVSTSSYAIMCAEMSPHTNAAHD